MTQKLTLEIADDAFDKVLPEIRALIRKVDSDIAVNFYGADEMAKQKKLLVKIMPLCCCLLRRFFATILKIVPGSFVFAELFFSRLADFAKGSQKLVLRTGF